MAERKAAAGLGDVNSATLGAKFPEVVLPDGSKVQTGTVGALLVNIKNYDNLVHSKGKATESQIEELEDMFRAALPTLDNVGLFELFPPDEWIVGSKGSSGKARVGELALQYQRQKLNDGKNTT